MFTPNLTARFHSIGPGVDLCVTNPLCILTAYTNTIANKAEKQGYDEDSQPPTGERCTEHGYPLRQHE